VKPVKAMGVEGLPKRSGGLCRQVCGRQFQEIGKALGREIGQSHRSASPALRIDGVELDQRVRPICSNLDLDW
jgi:hypothetical protein